MPGPGTEAAARRLRNTGLDDDDDNNNKDIDDDDDETKENFLNGSVTTYYECHPILMSL